jgi:E3 ubiquitin-protein ligase RNF144
VEFPYKDYYKNVIIGKVADNATLLEPRGRRLVTTIATTHASPSASRRSRSKVDLLAMPGLKTLVNRRRNSGTETQAPLVKQNGSSGNLIKPAASMASLRKYETVLTVTGVLRSSSSSSSVEPLQPVNRLRVPQESTSRFCSRCSSILTLASTSRYSLNSSTGGFIPILKETLLLCKLCLAEVPSKDACCIEDCKCSFCAEVRKLILFSGNIGIFNCTSK